MKDEDLVAILRSTWRHRVVDGVIVATVAAAVGVLWWLIGHDDFGAVIVGLLGLAFMVVIDFARRGARRLLGIQGAREALIRRAGWQEFQELVRRQGVQLEDGSAGTWALAAEVTARRGGLAQQATVTVPPEGAATRHRVVRRLLEEGPDPRTWFTQRTTELDEGDSNRLRELLASTTMTPLAPKHELVRDGAPFRLVASAPGRHPAFDLEGDMVSRSEDARILEIARLVLGPLRDPERQRSS